MNRMQRMCAVATRRLAGRGTAAIAIVDIRTNPKLLNVVVGARSFATSGDHGSVHKPEALPTPRIATPSSTPVPLEIRSDAGLRRLFKRPSLSYEMATSVFAELERRGMLREKDYLRIMSMAIQARQFAAIKTYYRAFQGTLNEEIEDDESIAVSDGDGHPRRRDGVKLAYRPARCSWPRLSAERLQMHRHLLWSMLHMSESSRPPIRSMTAFHRARTCGVPNAPHIYESDPLNFLLRMECTFEFTPSPSVEDAGDSWLGRIQRILEAMTACDYRANFSSAHALFYMLMHRTDVALASSTRLREDFKDEEPEMDTPQPDERIECGAVEKAINHVLDHLLTTYPTTLPTNPRHLSVAISTAASAGRLGSAHHLLQRAETHALAVDAASFAHLLAATKDENERRACAGLYLRAKESNRLYVHEANDSMKNYLLLYAIHAGNFTQIMELLHEMEYNNIAATPKTFTALFASFSQYRAQARTVNNRGDETTAEVRGLVDCPTTLQLITNFPKAIPRTPHSLSFAILHALRAGDLEDAVKLLRMTVWSTDITLRHEIFAQVIYALQARIDVANPTPTQLEELKEVERLYLTQHPGEHRYLGALLLNLCESTGDISTMWTVLDQWNVDVGRRGPLSKRAMHRVFDAVHNALERFTVAEHADLESRLAVGGTELSFRALLERFPLILPCNATTLSAAIVRSATAGLTADVCTLVQVAHTKSIVLPPIACKIGLEVLLDSPLASPNQLEDCILTMKANGSWASTMARYPQLASRFGTRDDSLEAY